MAGEKCKHDGKDIYKDSAGAWQHSRRVTAGSAPAGTSERRKPPAGDPPPPSPQPEPKREHALHRKLFGAR